jgi:hypothetical protein
MSWSWSWSGSDGGTRTVEGVEAVLVRAAVPRLRVALAGGQRGCHHPVAQVAGEAHVPEPYQVS